MLDFDKLIMKMLTPFVALLTAMLCIWGVIEIVRQIWLGLLILLAILGVLAVTGLVIWFRFRRW